MMPKRFVTIESGGVLVWHLISRGRALSLDTYQYHYPRFPDPPGIPSPVWRSTSGTGQLTTPIRSLTTVPVARIDAAVNDCDGVLRLFVSGYHGDVERYYEP